MIGWLGAGLEDGSVWGILRPRFPGDMGAPLSWNAPTPLAPLPSFPGFASILAYKQSGWEEDENLSGCGHKVFNTPFMGPSTAPSGIISFCPLGDSWQMGVESCEEGGPMVQSLLRGIHCDLGLPLPPRPWGHPPLRLLEHWPPRSGKPLLCEYGDSQLPGNLAGNPEVPPLYPLPPWPRSEGGGPLILTATDLKSWLTQELSVGLVEPALSLAPSLVPKTAPALHPGNLGQNEA